MIVDANFLPLYRAVVWRLWREQRAAIVAVPLLMALLFAIVIAVAACWPGLLTGPTVHALQAAAMSDGQAAGPVGLARTFLIHQAPYLLAVFGGLSAASITSRLVGGEADRGSLEILLASRHDIAAIGGAMLLAACSIASGGWVVLIALSYGATALLDATLHLGASSALPEVGVAIAMQLVLTLLAAELTLIVTLLWPALGRIRTGVTADPTSLIAALPALAAFIAANLLPHLSVLRLSLCAFVAGLVLLVVGAASIRLWFRPEKFLES